VSKSKGVKGPNEIVVRLAFSAGLGAQAAVRCRGAGACTTEHGTSAEPNGRPEASDSGGAVGGASGHAGPSPPPVVLVYVVALAAANTGHVKVNWVFGSSSVALVWLVLFTAILGWLLGILITALFRWRTRAPRPS
jgi:hypothetical protein